MFSRLRVTLALLLLLLLAGEAFGEEAWRLAILNFRQAFMRSDIPEAANQRSAVLRELREAMVVKRNIGDGKVIGEALLTATRETLGGQHPGHMETIGLVAAHYSDAGLHEEAGRMFDGVIAFFESEPKYSSRLPVLLVQRGTVYSASGKFALAEPLFARAIDLLTTSDNLESDRDAVTLLATAHGRLRWSLANQGKNEDAVKAGRNAVKWREKLSGPESAEVIAARTLLAYDLRAAGEYKESESALRDVIRLSEKRDLLPAAEFPQIYWNLASTIGSQGRPDDAIPWAELAIKKFEELGDRNSMAYASVQSLLAGLLFDARRNSVDQRKRSIELHVNAKAPQYPTLFTELRFLAQAQEREGDQSGAFSSYEKAYSWIASDDEKVRREIPMLYEWAWAFLRANRHQDVIRIYRRIVEVRGSAEPIKLAADIRFLAAELNTVGERDEGRKLFQSVFKLIPEKDHLASETIFHARSGLALLEWQAGNHAVAAGHYEMAVRAATTKFGATHKETTSLTRWWAATLGNAGRSELAIKILNDQADALEREAVPSYPELVETVVALAEQKFKQKDVAGGANAILRARDIARRGGPIAMTLERRVIKELLAVYIATGEYEKADALAGEYLASIQMSARKVARTDSGEVEKEIVDGLQFIAATSTILDRGGNGDAIFAQYIDGASRMYGERSAKHAEALQAYGYRYLLTGRPKEALGMFEKAYETARLSLGAANIVTVRASAAAGSALVELNRPGEALPRLLEAYEILEKESDFVAPDIALRIATGFALLNRPADSQRYFEIVLKYPTVAGTVTVDRQTSAYFGLGYAKYAQGKSQESLAIFRNAVERIYERAGALSPKVRQVYWKRYRLGLRAYVWALQGIVDSASSEEDRTKAVKTAFEIFQLHRANETAAALSQMAVRLSQGDSELGRQLKEYNALGASESSLEKAMIESITAGGEKQGQEFVRRLENVRVRMRDVERVLKEKFPEYSELVGASPSSIEDVQKHLAPDEALVAWALGEMQSNLVVVKRVSVRLIKLPRNVYEIREQVSRLRSSLDPASGGELKPFRALDAFELYRSLLEPAARDLEDVRHLIVVPDGPTTSLPLSVLLTSSPSKELMFDAQEFAQAPWLARRFAVTTLPAISSFLALARVTKVSDENSNNFFGVGNPLLAPIEPTTRNVRNAGVEMARVFRGGAVQADQLRTLPSLPETEAELKALASNFPEAKRRLLVGQEATEGAVKAGSLGQFGVLAFATHGIVAGELTGLEEPALVLTPPEIATETDDGLLTASEVGTLKLNADWVVLSACNTASSDGAPGADGLSGLAKAFFFAGARSLLVSHWSVPSEVTVRLTTSTVLGARTGENRRAAAHQKAMLGLIDSGTLVESHPTSWGAFAVVGSSVSRGAVRNFVCEAE